MYTHGTPSAEARARETVSGHAEKREALLKGQHCRKLLRNSNGERGHFWVLRKSKNCSKMESKSPYKLTNEDDNGDIEMGECVKYSDTDLETNNPSLLKMRRCDEKP